MKKVILSSVLAVGLFALPCAPAFADASSSGCQHSQGRAAGCSDDPGPTAMPEPATMGMVALGLIVVGGAAIALRRKRTA